MPTCFVIQPFDQGKFDKRYEQVYRPAIVDAGLEPYRVDQDPRVQIPIEAIEQGIRNAGICLADITTDNPNVWYELGFAFALGAIVVMVCSVERTSKFPFDIQHRTIIEYKVDAPNDFDHLKATITTRIKASLVRDGDLRQLARIEPVSPVAGLAVEELTVLAVTAGLCGAPDSTTSLFQVQKDAERASITPVGIGVGLHGLGKKGFIRRIEATDQNDYPYSAIEVLDEGWEWIGKNRKLFQLRKGGVDSSGFEIRDDDIPF